MRANHVGLVFGAGTFLNWPDRVAKAVALLFKQMFPKAGARILVTAITQLSKQAALAG